jgi:cbb3-type cytochrome oxidase maturation protein
MSYLAWLVPLALSMGAVGLLAFLWSMRSGQYEDLDGAAERVLLADAADAPLHQAGRNGDRENNDPSSTPERARDRRRSFGDRTQGAGYDRSP